MQHSTRLAYHQGDLPDLLCFVFSLKIYLFSVLTVVGLCCYIWAFSSCDKRGLFSSCGVCPSLCGGSSDCGAWALGPVGFSTYVV